MLPLLLSIFSNVLAQITLPPNALNLVLTYAFNLLVTYIIVQHIYRRNTSNATFVFTYYIFNTLIFFICLLMANLDLGIGFAFGLFALFSIMRYRTTTIDIKEMTFLFVVVCTAVMNALGSNILELLFINGVIISLLAILNQQLFKHQLRSKFVIYEKIELIHLKQRAQLRADLQERTGLVIERIEIESVNFLNDSARIQIFYYNK